MNVLVKIVFLVAQWRVCRERLLGIIEGIEGTKSG